MAAMNNVDLRQFLISLFQGAMVGLGEAPDPDTNQKTQNLTMARYNLALLEMLKEKTAGNLSDEESKLLAVFLNEVGQKLEACSQK
jgi:hypothetical protein